MLLFRVFRLGSVGEWCYILWELSRSELINRYRGSVLSFAWLLLLPIMMLAVYTSVFVGIFRAQWLGVETSNGLDFALRVFAGLIVYSFFSEVVGRAPNAVRDRSALVTKVTFPLSVLPMIPVISAGIHQSISLVILLLAVALLGNGVAFSWFWIIPILTLTGATIIGLALIFAALGTYLPDVGHLMTPVVTAFLFLSPIFYPISVLPDAITYFMWLNPIATPIELLRAVVVDGTQPKLTVIIGAAFSASIIFAVGYSLFSRTKRGFVDVL